ncbi:MAG: DoxX family protein [Candidatus Nanosalina sp.]
MAQILIQVLRVFLGIFFLVSGLTKLKDLEAFADIAVSYAIVPEPVKELARWGSYGLVFTEVAVGALLILDIFTVLASAILSLNMAFFVIAQLYELKENPNRPNCGCFGTIFKLELSWKHIAMDIMLLLSSGFLALSLI